MGIFERQRNREDHATFRFVAWVLIATLPLWWFADDFAIWEPAIPVAVGVAILVWLRRLGPGAPEHVVTIEYVDFEDDAVPYFQATCDCGWEGLRQRYEETARHDGRQHAPHVLTPVEDFSE